MKQSTVKKQAQTIYQSDNGSMSLEAAIAAPIIILTVCLSVYIIILLFEHAQVQSSAGYAAVASSLDWRREPAMWMSRANTPGQNGGDPGQNGGGEKPANGSGLYNRLIDSRVHDKESKACTIAEMRKQMICIEGFTYAAGSAKYAAGIFGRNILLTLRSAVVLPNHKVMSVFGYSNVINAPFSAKSLIPDFHESIRNIDYALEIEKKLEEASPEFMSIAGSFKDVVGHIRGFIGGLM